MTATTLEHVAMQARPYPDHLLEGCHTGLALFAAAFLGWNDAVHYALAGMRGTCVDTDGVRLAEMASVYPEDWQWAYDDAWKYAQAARQLGERWDAVSVDTFTGDAMRRALDSLDLWCSISRRLVTVTYTDGAGYETPDDWNASLYPRSGRVHWLTLTPCSP